MIWVNISAITLIFLAVNHFISAGRQKDWATGLAQFLFGTWELLCGIMLFVKC